VSFTVKPAAAPSATKPTCGSATPMSARISR
jgi:hypothetical protein